MLIKKRAGRRPALRKTRAAQDYKRSTSSQEQTQTSTQTQRTLPIKKKSWPQASFQKDKRCARLEEKHELTRADTDKYTATEDLAH